jgi:pyruvate formate lyase activating enzyme
LDYPDKTACILWFAGCNMRCLYCYNPEIVLGKGKIEFEKVLQFLQKRKGLLDAVVFSGGECTIHKQIIPYIQAIKKAGFLVKVDTNGSNPAFIQKAIEASLLDYVAVDFKAPFSKFETITKSEFHSEFSQTLQILIQSNIPFEIRTTVHSELLNEEDLMEMCHYLHQHGYKKTLYIQQFINHTKTLSPLPYSKNQLSADRFQNFPIPVVLRN